MLAIPGRYRHADRRRAGFAPTAPWEVCDGCTDLVPGALGAQPTNHVSGGRRSQGQAHPVPLSAHPTGQPRALAFPARLFAVSRTTVRDRSSPDCFPRGYSPKPCGTETPVSGRGSAWGCRPLLDHRGGGQVRLYDQVVASPAVAGSRGSAAGSHHLRAGGRGGRLSSAPAGGDRYARKDDAAGIGQTRLLERGSPEPRHEPAAPRCSRALAATSQSRAALCGRGRRARATALGSLSLASLPAYRGFPAVLCIGRLLEIAGGAVGRRQRARRTKTSLPGFLHRRRSAAMHGPHFN